MQYLHKRNNEYFATWFFNWKEKTEPKFNLDPTIILGKNIKQMTYNTNEEKTLHILNNSAQFFWKFGDPKIPISILTSVNLKWFP